MSNFKYGIFEPTVWKQLATHKKLGPSREKCGLGPLAHNPAAGSAAIEVSASDSERARALIDDYFDSMEEETQWEDTVWEEPPKTDQDRIEEAQKSFTRRLIIGFFFLFSPFFALGPGLCLFQLKLAWDIAKNSDVSLSGWGWFALLALVAIPYFLVAAIWTLLLFSAILGFDF